MDSDSVRSFFKKDRFAGLANVELLTVSPGYARAKMVVQPHHLNANNTVQGGAIFTLADLTFAGASNSHGTVAVGIDATISYIKAATGGTLWAEAKELSRNHKLGVYTVEIKDDAGELVALFQGMVYRKKDPITP